MNDDAILGEVAAAVGLREGVAGVRDVVRATARFEPVAVRKLSRAAALPVPIVSAICNELRKREVVARERPVRLTALGRALFGAGARAEEPELGPAVRRLATAVARAPLPRFDLDQAHCDLDTKVKRVLALHEADALVDRTVLLLGDDDLVSLALALLGAPLGARPARVVVLDVHGALLAFLRDELRRAPFAVDVRRHDLREPLPEWVRGAVDTVFTDPPYTVAGAELFLSRAAQAVAGDRRGDVFFAFGSRAPDEELRVQRSIAAMGFVTKRLERNFNEYVGAGTLGGVSHLYHLTSTRETKPLLADRYEGPLYTADRR